MAITYAVELGAAAETPGAADIACGDATIEPTNDNPAHLGALPAPASTHINSSLSGLICFESIVGDESDEDADGENSFLVNEQSAAASTCPAPSPGEPPMLMCGHLRI